jgi:hypothetical protein
MKLVSFIKSLLPHMSKDQILEDLRVTAGEMEQVVIPSYRDASVFFRSNKLRSDEAKDISDDFYRGFERGSMSKQSSVIGEIDVRLNFIKENLTYVQGQIEAILERDVINEGLTAKKAVMIRAANQLAFISRFSTDLLNYFYVCEASASDADVAESMVLAPAVIKHVKTNVKMFAMLLSDYGIPTEKFQAIYTKIPEVVVSSRNEASIAGLYKQSDIDPFDSPFVAGFTGNPIYHVRLLYAEWQASRYKAEKEKKRMLELRLLHLRLLQEKKNDPKLEAEINYIQSRVDGIERYMRSVEDTVEV